MGTINNTQKGDANDINVVGPMYNLISKFYFAINTPKETI